MWAVSWENGELVPCTKDVETQLAIIEIELSRLQHAYGVTGWPTVPVEQALHSLTTQSGALFVFVNDSVMCLCEDRPWFSAERVLYEEFIGIGIGLETVVDVMIAVCAVSDIKRYVAGTRAAANQRHAGLAKLYSKEGLTISAIELMGVVSNGQKDSQGSGQV